MSVDLVQSVFPNCIALEAFVWLETLVKKLVEDLDIKCRMGQGVVAFPQCPIVKLDCVSDPR